ncbi:hypothetical protein COCOBI_06-5170 [Coccomyxa sp. Obi]|nr:hypothetical protein COCOBI_06-5170 [Coccomyxa sp. Obi]
MPSDERPVVERALDELWQASALLQALAAFTSISLGLISVLCNAMLDVDPTAESVKQLDMDANRILSLWTTQPGECVLAFMYSDFDKYSDLIQWKELTVTEDTNPLATYEKLWSYVCQHPVKFMGSFAFQILSYLDEQSLRDVGELLDDVDPAIMEFKTSVELIRTAGAVVDLFAQTIRATYHYCAALGHTFTAVDEGYYSVKGWCCEFDRFVKTFHDVAGLTYREVAPSLSLDCNAIMEAAQVEAIGDEATAFSAQPPTKTKARRPQAPRKVRSMAAASSGAQDEAEPTPARKSTKAGSGHTAT